MKKTNKYKKKKPGKRQILLYCLLFLLFGFIAIILPTVQTNKFSYGAVIPSSAPSRPELQLVEYNPLLTPTATPPPQQQQPPPQPNQPVKTNPPGNNVIPPNFNPQRFQPRPVGPTAPKSNGQLCSVADNSGKAVSGSCYCPALTVTCKNKVGYGANGALYPGVNPCGSSAAPGSGRYCVEKPVIYLYPTIPTPVTVQVFTRGTVIISNPTYPQGGWKNVLAEPDGTLHYNGEDYSELFYESSVSDFQKPLLGITIPTNQLSEKLGTLLDQLGLIGNEKKEFLSFWLPRLQALNSPYVFFSILTPQEKSTIDRVVITPKPDTQIAFIAYFKAALQPADDTLALPPMPKRLGFISVEWGGVIGQ